MSAATSGLFFDLVVAFAILGMLLTIIMTLQRLRAASQRETEQARERAALTAAYTQLAAAKAAAEQRAAQLTATLAGMSDGVMMVDRDLRLLQWNDRWTELAGVPREILHVGAPFEEILRAQVVAGEFGRVDVEAEVARRLSRISALGNGEDIERQRPNGQTIRLRRRVLADGSLLSVVSDITSHTRRAATSAPARDTAPEPARTPARPLRRCFILLVEDIVVNQVVTATQLRRDGHRVDIASSGAEALRLVASQPYDIVLMDLMMPGMSGLDAARAIRRMPGFVARVPIVALTASARAQDRALCVAAGMQAMLSKPVRPEELVEAMAAALGYDVPAVRSITGPLPSRRDKPPPRAPAAAQALLDTARLGELRDGLPPGLFEQLAHQCVVDMRERMMDLHDAVETGMLDRVGIAAHALAGMAGSYGMAAAERRMRRMMESARSGDAAVCRAAAEGMDQELQQTDAALSALVRPQPA
jgi:CheY-like chemotaxis protein/PAS domain-containing protein